MFFRSKVLPDGERGGIARDEAVLAEIAPTLEYHAARLGRVPLARVFVHAAVPGCDALLERLAAFLPVPATPLAATAVSSARVPASIAGSLTAAVALACRGLGEPKATKARDAA